MTDDEVRIAFPDGPRSELDHVVERLVSVAGDVLATQGRLRSLLAASRFVANELELPAVLRRIVEAATKLVGAEYGAIGVTAAGGTLAQFIHVGMPDDLVKRIGHLPEGRGLLGALIDEQEPIRLHELSADPRSIGFPAGHPEMHTFLGVPVRVRGEVFGNLYLAESSAGAFTEEDQELLVALADTAGAAIDHARLYAESQRRQQWASASAEVTAALLSEDEGKSLAILVDRVAVLADAELVCIATPSKDGVMTIEVARGERAGAFEGMKFDSDGTLAGRAYESGQPVLSGATLVSRVDPQVSFGPTMAIPLISADSPRGVLTISRAVNRPSFSAADLDMASEFAAQASVALRIASMRSYRERVAILEDRGRIARDLHDTVIQRLFGAGLSLQATAGAIPDPAASSRIAQEVGALDLAISEIRTAIFTLANEADATSPTLRHRVIDLVGEQAELFPESPSITFTGAVDIMVDNSLSDDVVAVIREGLSNVVRHAKATAVSVSVSAVDGTVVVVIEDDGIGIPATPTRRSGTANLERRATMRNGSFSTTPRDGGGTVLRWEVPLANGSEH